MRALALDCSREAGAAPRSSHTSTGWRSPLIGTGPRDSTSTWRSARPTGGLGDHRGARTRQLLHACGEVGGLAHRGVLHVEVAADRADDDLAGVDADPDLHVEALTAPDLLGVLRDRALHPEGRVAGAHRVVLVGHRRAEQGHDAVAHHLVDGALEAVDGFHQSLDDRVEQGAGVFRIAVDQQLEGALQVGEEDGDRLALTGQRGPRGEDLAGQVARRVGVGRGKADVTGRQGSAALLAELVGRWVERGAGRARQLEPRSTFTAELGAVRVLVTAPGALHPWYSPPVWVNGRLGQG